MKILIMGFSKIKYMPYIKFYFDNMDKTQNEVHILYWNRDMQDEDLSKFRECELHEFRCYQKDDVAKQSKIKNFVKYRKFAKKILKKEKFDFIIALHSSAAILLSNTLRKNYHDRYIFDYRDITYEYFTPYRKIIAKVVRHSCATFVSSDAFRDFLPQDCAEKIYTSHNLLMGSLDHRNEKIEMGIQSDKIRLSFWGFIREEEINKEIIRKIAADDRFELHYYGKEQQVVCNLKEYTVEIGAKNVFFHGEYRPEDRYIFVRNTDLIHNIYNSPNMMRAMANKYYDAAIFYIPLVSINGSVMAQRAEKARIGISADPYEPDFTDRLYSAYQSLDRKEFENNCDEEIRCILHEYTQGADYIRKATTATMR